jgi:hypothetical protein
VWDGAAGERAAGRGDQAFKVSIKATAIPPTLNPTQLLQPPTLIPLHASALPPPYPPSAPIPSPLLLGGGVSGRHPPWGKGGRGGRADAWSGMRVGGCKSWVGLSVGGIAVALIETLNA